MEKARGERAQCRRSVRRDTPCPWQLMPRPNEVFCAAICGTARPLEPLWRLEGYSVRRERGARAMPPAHVHFNGSVNLAEAESVVREIVARVPSSVRRIPDGETRGPG